MCDDLESPLVSVILPAYNRAHLLRRSMQSVLSQSYSNLELIVVDDCSKDNTADVVASFHDTRVRYIHHERNLGADVARNTGIASARGYYIAFQDSDDEWLPGKLGRQMSAFKSVPKDVGVVYTNYWLINQGAKLYSALINRADRIEGSVHESLLNLNFIALPTAVVKKECFEKVGGFERLPRCQDWTLWLKISKYYSFKLIDAPLVNVYRQPDSIFQNSKGLITARKFILNEYYSDLSKDNRLLRNHYYEIATALCFNNQIGEGRTYFFKALKTNPFYFKLLISTFLSFFGARFYLKIAKLGQR